MIRGLCVATVCLGVIGCGPNFKDTPNLDSSGSAIICFGDSITRGFGASPGNDYPAQLGALIGRPVINAGVDGNTTADALRRMDHDVLAHDPWIVIIELSGNDLLRRIPEPTTRNNLDIIVTRVVNAGAIPVLVHAKFGVLTMDPYRDTFAAMAEKHDTVLVENVLRGILGNRERMYDEIHPNDAGYALLAERVAEVVAPLIEASESARADT